MLARISRSLLALGLVVGAASSLLARPPNVVLIIGDDMAWSDFGFMGHEKIDTPNLDRLAARSLVFPRGYVTASLCCPSLATIITGLYPYQHRITGNEPPAPPGLRGKAVYRDPGYRAECVKMDDSIEKVPTLPRLLGNKGYVSHQSGKWWHGSHRRGGFTHGMTHGDPDRGGRHGDEGLKIGRRGLEPIFRFIEEAGGRPFFVWYAPFLPHTPHNPPERLLAKYRSRTESLPMAKYWAMCEWFDETCGELLGYLDRKGLADDTLVVYVTDNGWINRRNASRYAPRSKRSPYDGGVRTPILLRWPGRVKPRKDSTPVSSVDLAPTILAACGLVPTREMRGIDLLDEAALKKRDAVFGAIYLHNARDIHRPEKNLMYRWCVAGRFKLIAPDGVNVEGRDPELYDIVDDPHETRNLAESQRERVRALTGRLDGWWKPAS